MLKMPRGVPEIFPVRETGHVHGPPYGLTRNTQDYVFPADPGDFLQSQFGIFQVFQNL